MLVQKEVECIDNLYRIAADIYSLHGFEVMKALSALQNDFGYITKLTVDKLMHDRQLEFSNDDFKLLLNRLNVRDDRRLRAEDFINQVFEMTHPNYYNVKDYIKLRTAGGDDQRQVNMTTTRFI